MAFIITGDTHGLIDIGKVVKFFDGREDEYDKTDYLIICGDVNVCGFSKETQNKTREIFRNLPVTTLFVDGNHEHFDELDSYEIVEWNGGKIHMIEDSIIHLMRGQVFEIDGVKFFTFGGAYSIDKAYRSPGLSWFPQELPTYVEYEEGWNNLEKNGFQVDYILTHTGPREIVASMGYGEMSSEEIELRQYLQRVADNTDFTAWYFGHFHEDMEVEDCFYCVFDEMIVL